VAEPGRQSMVYHRAENGEPRILGMHPEKLVAWLVRLLAALLLFILQSMNAAALERIKALQETVGQLSQQIKSDHDITIRLATDVDRNKIDIARVERIALAAARRYREETD